MTKEEVAKVKRNLKKYGFKQHRLLKGFYIRLYNECTISISFTDPMPDTFFMTVVMELDDDYELCMNSILHYSETLNYTLVGYLSTEESRKNGTGI